MLNVNPKKRPSIYEIIQMPFLKQRVINYAVSIYKLSSVSPTGNLGYEDLYLSTVEQQCKTLGIYEQVQAGVSSSELISSHVKKLNSAAKNSQSAVHKRKNQEQELARNKKLSENLSQKIQILEAKLNSQQEQIPNKDKVLYNKQVKKMQAIREREMQLEEIREKNDRERKDIKQKFMRQNFQSNAVEKVLKGQQTD